MRDFETFSTFATTSILAALTYAVQVKLRAIGRSDGAEYEEKYLTPEKLGAAAFSRASWSTLFPMAMDTAGNAVGLDPLFDMRSSQLPSNFVMGNPTMSLFDSLATGGKGFTRAGGMTQNDLRKVWSLAPFQNFLPAMWGFNSLISDLPEKSN
jgi:hypothetical protein